MLEDSRALAWVSVQMLYLSSKQRPQSKQQIPGGKMRGWVGTHGAGGTPGHPRADRHGASL